MINSPFADDSMAFAVDIIKLCDTIHNRGPIKNQLLRCATAIGANIREAHYGYSKNDFICKLQIALKECHETLYWLELLYQSETISEETSQELIRKCERIRYKLAKSLNTAKIPES